MLSVFRQVLSVRSRLSPDLRNLCVCLYFNARPLHEALCKHAISVIAPALVVLKVNWAVGRKLGLQREPRTSIPIKQGGLLPRPPSSEGKLTGSWDTHSSSSSSSYILKVNTPKRLLRPLGHTYKFVFGPKFPSGIYKVHKIVSEVKSVYINGY